MSYQFLNRPVGEEKIVSRILRRIVKYIFAIKFTLYHLLLILILITNATRDVQAQYDIGSIDAPFLRPIPYQESDVLTLLDSIKFKLAQPYGDTVKTYVEQSIAQFCGQDYDCLINLHHRLRDFSIDNNHYLIALTLGKASVQLALQNDDPYNVGLAYIDLSFYYEDLGRIDSMIASLEKSLPHFEKSGGCFRIFKTKTELLERKYGNKPNEVVPLMEKNLKEAKRKGCKEAGLLHILKRLVEYTARGSMWDMNKKYLEELEQSIDTTSDVFEHRHAAIYTHLGRAKIYLRETPQQIEKANEHLLHALEICYDIPYPLFGVEILYRLARLEWNRQNPDKAFVYLEEAISMGKENKVYHYLSIAYRIKAEFLEKQVRFQEALEATRNDHRYRKEHREMLVGLDLRDYYMEIEKEQMATEQKNKALQLQLKDSQLRNSVYIIVSVLILSLALLYGFFKLRNQKSALAKQYTLIQQQAEQLKQLDKAKSRFFANVSHELRTPISLILGPIDTISNRNQLKEEDQQLLKLARQGGKNLEILVNEILDLVKMESGKLELKKTDVHLAPFFKHYFAQFESMGYHKGISYSYEILLPENHTALLDQEKCRQIIFNLLSNAFKFTSTNEQVKASVQLKGNQLQFSVSDTGKGIHSTDLPNVFDRYFQTNQPDAPASGGTGIGLALCNEYAKLFGGKISVDSKLGEGSVFTVQFPVELEGNDSLTVDMHDQLVIGFEDLQEQPDQFRLATTSPKTPMNTSKPKLLVVEDNVELQTYLQLILKQHYVVSVAENGKAALDYLDKNDHPDLIISDLMMPVMDGYQLLENLKGNETTQQIPAIMLTARAGKDDRLKALRIGVDDYLTKPFQEEELLVRIANLLKNYAQRQAAPKTENGNTSDAPTTVTVSQPDREWLETFEVYVQKNIANDALTIPFLSSEFAMSESTLRRQVTRLTGLTPKLYLQEVRLNTARQLLENQAFRTVAKVAEKAGYSNYRTFTRNYKERFGKSPREYLNG